MDTAEILRSIDAEIDRLEKVRDLMTDHAAPVKRGRAGSGRKRKVSPEARERMAAAQRKRWAKTKAR